MVEQSRAEERFTVFLSVVGLAGVIWGLVVLAHSFDKALADFRPSGRHENGVVVGIYAYFIGRGILVIAAVLWVLIILRATWRRLRRKDLRLAGLNDQ